MRVVFLGSGSFAIPSFEALLAAGHELAALVTQPDREKGRGRRLAPPPLKPVAEARGVRVLQPPRIKAPEALAELRALAPEIQVVVAYGQILPRALVELPRRGTLNVHASLLPRYRGAAPVQWAIARGETETGVTTMCLDEGLDTGPLLLQRPEPIGPTDTAPALEARLAAIGAALLLETLRGLEAGTLSPVAQDGTRATHAPILKREDAVLDWGLPAEVLERRIRGFQPWPGGLTRLGELGLKVLRAEVAAPGPGKPGELVEVGRAGLLVACGGSTRLRLLELQPESRRPMSAAAFAAGTRVADGARLG